jgi:hypothetical protein
MPGYYAASAPIDDDQALAKNITAVKPRYNDAAAQTETLRSPTARMQSDDLSCLPDAIYPMTEAMHHPALNSEIRLRQNPFRVGAMSSFFKMPGYRLGDALL